MNRDKQLLIKLYLVLNKPCCYQLTKKRSIANRITANLPGAIAKYLQISSRLTAIIGLTFLGTIVGLAVPQAALGQAVVENTQGGTFDKTSTNNCNSFFIRSFNINDNFVVGDVSLGLNISHTYRGDIVGLLQAPSGNFIQFLGTNGNDFNDNYNVLFEDGGSAINDGNNDAVSSPFYDRTVNPDTALSAFAGESSAGTWRLYLCDGNNDSNRNRLATYNRSQLTLLPISISGFAYDDVNLDNTRGAAETTLTDIGVTAYRDDGDGVYEPNAGDSLIATTETNNNGAYAFSGLTNGNYWIDVDETDPDLVGRNYGGSAAANNPDPRLVSFSGTAVTDIDFPFTQNLESICEPGDPSGELTFLEGAVLEQGDDLQIGARYRFSDVFQNVDALVEVVAFNGGASLNAIDNDDAGVLQAFQPVLNAANNTTSSVDFNITLVAKGTRTPVALSFKAAGVDIDGNGQQLREFIELTNLTSFTLSDPTSLDATSIASGNRFASNTIVAQPGVSTGAEATLAIAQYDLVSQFRYSIGGIDGGSTGALQRLNSLYVGCTNGPPAVSDPNVLLVKRITAIDGDRDRNPNDNTPLNTFVDDTVSTRPDDDNYPNWPDNYLIGAIDAGKVQPGDEIEYTIYFLNAGNTEAENLRICDRITPNQDLKLDAYGAGNDLQLQLDTQPAINLTSANDSSDRVRLIPSAQSVPANCYLKGANDNGTLLFDITGTGNTNQSDLTSVPGSTGKGTPDNSYGLIRFTTTLEP